MAEYDDEEIVELNIVCPCEQKIEYSIFTKMDGMSPMCGMSPWNILKKI